MTTRPAGDELLVRRAAREMAVRLAVFVAVAMLVLVALVTIVVVRGQASAADELLRTTLRTADDVDDPPAGTWLLMEGPSGVEQSPGLPTGLSGDLAALRGSADASTSLTTVERDEGEYRVATVRRDDRPIQAVLDLATTHRQRTVLLQAMAIAGGIALALAATTGVALGRRAVRPLAEALALQRMFVANASHELRTPLTLLSTRAQVLDRALRRSGGLGEDVLRDSHGVVQDAQRLGEVVDDLLLAADPHADERHEPVGFDRLVLAVADSAKAHASRAGIALISVAESAPGTSVVLGSPIALRRAVLALVDNAIDHTPRDGEVRLTVGRRGQDVVLAVSDTGPGVAPGDAERVLRRFDSGGQRSGRAHYGLGLALTHDVANRHGGRLRLVPGTTGATFELALPAVDGSAADAPSNI